MHSSEACCCLKNSAQFYESQAQRHEPERCIVINGALYNAVQAAILFLQYPSNGDQSQRLL